MHILNLPIFSGKIVQILLRPAIRFCLKNVISYGGICNYLKIEMIRIAADELAKTGQKITTSQVSVMTGINRKDVKNILTGAATPPEEFHVLKRVLTNWEQSQPFIDAKMRPKPLAYKGKDSFETLVQSVSKDLSPAAVLKELLRLNLIEKKQNQLLLRSGSISYAPDPMRILDLFSRDLETFSAVVEKNISENPTVRNPHFRTEFDNIFVADIPIVKDRILKETKAFHKRVRTFLAKHDADLALKTNRAGGAKVVLTSFGMLSEPAGFESDT